jgi:hypothetical protein
MDKDERRYLDVEDTLAALAREQAPRWLIEALRIANSEATCLCPVEQPIEPPQFFYPH